MRVLVCDDEENIRNQMKRFLGMEGIDLLTNIFYTGNEVKMNEFKNALAMNSGSVEMEGSKTRS